MSNDIKANTSLKIIVQLIIYIFIYYILDLLNIKLYNFCLIKFLK